MLVHKRAGELMACMGFIIYFIFICITVSFLRSVKLWVVWVFLFLVYVYGFCTSEIECNSHAGHLRWITGCRYLWNVKYLFTHQLSCVQPNLFCTIILNLYHVDWNDMMNCILCFSPLACSWKEKWQ